MDLATATLRVSIIGLAGSGKSTCATLVEEFAEHHGKTHSRVKLARPLYDLQAQVYAVAGVPLPEGAQDQLLMEALADALRRISPTSLADDFLARLKATDADVVINDDLRDPHVDAPVLRGNGFRIIRITCAEPTRQHRLAGRGDPTRSDRSTQQLDLIEPDVVIDNSGSHDEYRAALYTVLGSWL